MTPRQQFLSLAATSVTICFGFSTLPTDRRGNPATEATGDLSRQTALILHTAGAISTEMRMPLAKADANLTEINTLMDKTGQTQAAALAEATQTYDSIFIAQLREAKQFCREWHAQSIAKAQTAFPDLDPREIEFIVAKAEFLSALDNLDSPVSTSPEATKQKFREMMAAARPAIAEASFASEMGEKILDLVKNILETVICERLMRGSGGGWGTLIGGVACTEVLRRTVEAIEQSYQNKFKSLSPVQILQCFQQAVQQSVPHDVVNPNSFGPYAPNLPSTMGFPGLPSPDQIKEVLDISSSLNKAFDQCVEEKNKEIERQRQAENGNRSMREANDKMRDHPDKPEPKQDYKDPKTPREPVERPKHEPVGPKQNPGHCINYMILNRSGPRLA